MKKIHLFAPVSIIITLFCSCANRVAPTGGEKDIAPPVVLFSVPANNQLNFSARKITITFNEYVQLKEVQKLVLVSPPLSPAPLFEIRKKSIIISLPDTLQPNTTYTINFGNAIIDFTEGNSLADYQYVFSTGSIIDSLIVAGKVQDALTHEPVKSALIMLYPSSVHDSIIGKAPPAYYGRTSDDGKFVIRNVRPGDYRATGLDDKNINFAFDADEPIGTGAEIIQLKDSSGIDILVNRQPPVKQSVKSSRLEPPGKLVTAFAKPVKDPKWIFPWDDPGAVLTGYSAYRDTVILYCSKPILDSVTVIWTGNDMITDTLFYRPERSFVATKNLPPLTGVVFPQQGGILVGDDGLRIRWAAPLKSADFTKISIVKDSIPVVFQGSFADSIKTITAIEGEWTEGMYNLQVLPGSVTDIHNRTNDTIKTSFSVPSDRTVGSIAYNFGTYKTGNFLLQLVNEKYEIIRQRVVRGSSKGVFDKLSPGSYKLRVISDENGNSRWDGGNVRENIPPERVSYYKDQVTVRSNWEIEVEWAE